MGSSAYRSATQAQIASTGDFEIRAKLADFGVSSVLPLARGVRSVRGAACGTLSFMPPELLLPPHVISVKTDVWSMGMLLWEMWTGELPFAGHSRSSIIQRIEQGGLPEWPARTPPWLKQLAARCWQKVRRRCPALVRVCESGSW